MMKLTAIETINLVNDIVSEFNAMLDEYNETGAEWIDSHSEELWIHLYIHNGNEFIIVGNGEIIACGNESEVELELVFIYDMALLGFDFEYGAELVSIA